MKYCILILSVVFLFFGCSHYNSNGSQDELVMIQTTDRNGITETISSKDKLKKMKAVNFSKPQPYKKVLRVFDKRKNANNFSVITSYHPNGNIFQYLEVEKARAKGYYREWFSNGTQKVEAIVIGGPADLSFSSQKEWLFDQTCFAWDETGKLVSKISYNQGILDGPSSYYHPNGSMQKVIPFKNGKIHGDLVEKNPDENIILKTHFENGKKEGPSFGYWENGKVKFLEEYNQDKLIDAQYYDKTNRLVAYIKGGNGNKATFEDGVLLSLIEHRDGFAEGKVETFSPDGQLISTYFFKNEKKQGEELVYFLQEEIDPQIKKAMSKALPKLSLTWDRGVLHGTMKTWYNNGQLESQRQMSKNKKNGTNCAWYKDGSLMMIEEYEEDILLKGRYYKPNCNKPVSTIENGMGIATLYDNKGIYLRKVKYIKGKPEE